MNLLSIIMPIPRFHPKYIFIWFVFLFEKNPMLNSEIITIEMNYDICSYINIEAMTYSTIHRWFFLSLHFILMFAKLIGIIWFDTHQKVNFKLNSCCCSRNFCKWMFFPNFEWNQREKKNTRNEKRKPQKPIYRPYFFFIRIVTLISFYCIIDII